MQRYKLIIEYDGAKFVGWQRQDNGLSVQEVVETAVEKFCGEKVTVFGAGRTDAGVHALGQVAHFDLENIADPDTVRDAINFHIDPPTIAVLSAEPVDEEFHARFSATERAYLYRIVNRVPPLALEHGRVWHVKRRLDDQAMHEAAQVLVGHHDFSSFRTSECQAKSPEKTVNAITVSRDAEEIRIEVRARSFLHNQVRIITGTLRLAGEGKWTAEDVAAALAARDRKAAGETAPAEGLYLREVLY